MKITFLLVLLQNRKSNAKIHEDAEGGIYVVGITTRMVQSLKEVSLCVGGVNHNVDLGYLIGSIGICGHSRC